MLTRHQEIFRPQSLSEIPPRRGTTGSSSCTRTCITPLLYSFPFPILLLPYACPYFTILSIVCADFGATLVKWKRQRVHVVQCGIMTVPPIHFNPFCVRVFGEIGSPVSFTKRVRVFGEIGSSVSFTKHSAPHVKKIRAQNIIRVRKKTN